VRLSTAITREEEALPLELVEATPDSVWFAGSKSVVEAGARDRAPAADRLGEALTSEAYCFLFEVVRWKEDCRVIAPTGGSEQPFVRFVTSAQVVPVLVVAA
jgi:hypothetical protein